MPVERNVGEVAELVRGSGQKCVLLVGAGCSVNAGVPPASGFVDLIEKHYLGLFRRLNTRQYNDCMAGLPPLLRRELIGKRVDKACINWAHVAIALLVAEGYVDRILTTNFDPLIIKACSLMGEFPAVYDLAASPLFRPAYVAEKAVFHLHGQRAGFVMLNTLDEFRAQHGPLARVLSSVGENRIWIVVGYSGESDPVFDHLVGIPVFDCGLFWVGFHDEDPPGHVRGRLLTERKYAYYVRAWDADTFLVSLARQLRCFPPGFCSRPFTHLEQLLNKVGSRSGTRDSGCGDDYIRRPLHMIRSAAGQYEHCHQPSVPVMR